MVCNILMRFHAEGCFEVGRTPSQVNEDLGELEALEGWGVGLIKVVKTFH